MSASTRLSATRPASSPSAPTASSARRQNDRRSSARTRAGSALARDVPQRPLEDADGLVDLRARDVERRDPTEDLPLWGARQEDQTQLQATLHDADRPCARGAPGGAVGHELDADHEPEAADIPDPVVAGGGPVERGPELAPSRRGVLDELLFADRSEY